MNWAYLLPALFTANAKFAHLRFTSRIWAIGIVTMTPTVKVARRAWLTPACLSPATTTCPVGLRFQAIYLMLACLSHVFPPRATVTSLPVAHCLVTELFCD